ncbi:molecular chaperone GroEL [Nonlabens sp. MIC269]|uniref:exosortase family protein XrtF n=1 Tax=Nonlabens sp. MIC269 TaxID=1476901 RepID=UPI00071ED0FC|nr:exosortase family protein XrtF [Nonlabens sp. MIC269]ALM20653.1 molecular chaperone GroEL [Nonlabens sp. MIC269]MEE2802456.1 exosortase family protein XrtF [Bacteroidota bacterium]
MLSSLRPYIPVFKFVAVFGGLYIGLSIIYYFYLSFDYGSYHYPDPITSQISFQTQELLSLIGYNAQTMNSAGHPSVAVYSNEQLLFRIIEGCNAVSVMILFCAFILAFAKAWKKTILFLLIGVGIIYVINLTRLVLLGIIYADYPAYTHVSHEIIFPAIIYGTTVLLWLYWLKKPKSKHVPTI